MAGLENHQTNSNLHLRLKAQGSLDSSIDLIPLFEIITVTISIKYKGKLSHV